MTLTVCDSKDVVITGGKKEIEKFVPISRHWSVKFHYHRKIDTSGVPLKVDKIFGEGITAFSEENHTLPATQTLESSRYKAAFEAILGR